MSQSRPAAPISASHARGLAAAPVIAIFTASLFLSALLLFAVQPMFAKMVLPVLGGSPAVWSVAMCFFQLTLLGGYAYAHVISSYFRTPLGIITHLGVMIAAMAFLPLAMASGWERPPGEGLHLWVLALFAVSIGLPFFALAGNAPLLQAWFSRTGHKHADDPYFLYGASNLGSLLALLSYPLVIEPALTLAEQSNLWSSGYRILAACVGICGLVMLVVRPTTRTQEREATKRAQSKAIEPISWGQRFGWLGLAFIPSGLLVSVTSHISTDVAAAPFLWVLPLALFLLTFVITFQRKPVIPHKFMLALQPLAVAMLVISLQFPVLGDWSFVLILHLTAFFISAMVCHGALVARRPAAQNLTEFYLWMSLGGALGGIFTGLVAPQIFSFVAEYPIMVVLSLLARPGFGSLKRKEAIRDVVLCVALLATLTAPKLLAGIDLSVIQPQAYLLIFAGLAAAIILSRPRPVRLVALVVTTLVAGHVLTPDAVKGETHRGFFGVHTLIEVQEGAYRLLMHGTTLHGAQKIAPRSGKPEMLSYYHDEGPFGDVIRAARSSGDMTRVAIVGLGAGTMACHREDSETWSFYEIDPIVARIASDPGKFRFLSECAPDAKIIIGDARLTLGDEPVSSFDLLVVDAFSSDAIPVHLITREAIQMYLEKIAPGGFLAFHISNNNMDLRPVVAAAMRDQGLVGLVCHCGAAGKLTETYKSKATVAVLARSEKDLEKLKALPGWKPLDDKGWRVWSDDYSNVLFAIREEMRAKAIGSNK